MSRILLPTLVLALVWNPSAYGVSRPTARVLALEFEPPPSITSTHAVRVAPPSEPAPVVPHVPVSLYNVNTHESRTFILTADGEVVGDRKDVDRFFRCRRSGRRHRMARGVLAMLAEIGTEYPGQVIEIVSGYRRRGFGVRRSKHFTGHAIDLRVRGVRTSKVRDFVWSGHEHSLGLGHYRGENFIHLDYRPERDKVGWTQRYRNSRYRYNPRWARVAPKSSHSH